MKGHPEAIPMDESPAEATRAFLDRYLRETATLLWPAERGYRVAELDSPYEERVGASKLRKLAGTAWTFGRLLRTLPIGERGGNRWSTGRFEVRR